MTLPANQVDDSVQEWIQRWESALIDPWPFVRDFVCTFDEHDFGEFAIEKPFPVKAMYRIICRFWMEMDIFFIEKSRQIMLTWIMCALFLWMCLRYKAMRVFLQSKKQEDANAILDRVKHIYDRLHRLNLPGLPQAKMTAERLGTANKLIFPESKSEMWAIPQGGDVQRSFTCSGWFSDESEFQPQFMDAYAAGIPTIDNGAKAALCSSVNGKSPVWRLEYGIDDRTLKPVGKHLIDSRRIDTKLFTPPDDLTPEEKRFWVDKQLVEMPDEDFKAIPLEVLVAQAPGMRYWQTAVGINVLQIYYYADPYKDPQTKVGMKWETKKRQELLNVFPREMQLKRNTTRGRPVISNWHYDHFVKPVDYDSAYALHMTFDFGTILGLCFYAQYRRIPDFNAYQLQIMAETVCRNADTPTLAHDVKLCLETRYNRNWVNRYMKGYADPNGMRKQDSCADASLNTSISIIEHALEGRVLLNSNSFSRKESTELLESVFMMTLPNGEPAVIIDPSCTYLISVCEGLHFPEGEKGPEGHYEKDGEFDHGGDGLRYLISNLFTARQLVGQADQERQERQVAEYEPHTGRLIGYRAQKSHPCLNGYESCYHGRSS